MQTLEDKLVLIIAEEINGGCLVNEPLGYDKFRPLAKRLLKEFAGVPVASNNKFDLTTPCCCPRRGADEDCPHYSLGNCEHS